jgi:acetyl esterase/lipase
MKKNLQLIAIVIAFLSTTPLMAQRYLTEVFDGYQVTEDVNFGVNVNPLIAVFPNPASATWVADSTQWSNEMAFLNNLIANYAATNPDTILSYINFFYPNSALPDSLQTKVKITPLEMDVYSPPASDTEVSRPAFVYIHTGNFLPPLYNGAITGDKADSAAANVCRQMAKRGYVAVSINYRLGWNPLATDENTRRGTLLQAVYRAVHDTQTAVRFLKALSSSYGIDPTKINLIGQGSGGYVAQAYTTLNDYVTEIAGLTKFIDSNTGFPFVIEARDGDLEGGPGFLRLIDPLAALVPNKDVCMSANMGGALADSTWLEAGDPPMVAFHCLRDPYAPFDHGMVVVPTTNENVVEVDGGNVFIRKANEFGNNDAFASIPDGDVYTDAARSTYGETYEYISATEPTMTVSETPEGLYPFILPLNGSVSVFGNQGSPWDWWDYATLEVVVSAVNSTNGTSFNAATLNANGLFSNPNMSQTQGLAYIDTIQGYLNPRVVLACNLVTGIAENVAVQNAMSIYPNPAAGSSAVTISNEKAEMSEIIVMDAIGKQVHRANVNGFEYRLNHDGWQTGMYFVTVLFKEGGQMTKKLILK